MTNISFYYKSFKIIYLNVKNLKYIFKMIKVILFFFF